MNNYSNLLDFLKLTIDFIIVWSVFYYTFRLAKNNSRMRQIGKGILFLVILNIIASLIELKAINYLLSTVLNWGFLAAIIIFQPEIRGALEKIGKSSKLSLNTMKNTDRKSIIDDITDAVLTLSDNQVGALISIQRKHSLEDFISKGIELNADVKRELLISIFMTTTPLHDGAVIIQGNKIACASTYLPNPSKELPNKYGARHRAALGMSEANDSVSIVVSEETSEISIAMDGKMFAVKNKELKKILYDIFADEAYKPESENLKEIKVPKNNRKKQKEVSFKGASNE